MTYPIGNAIGLEFQKSDIKMVLYNYKDKETLVG